MNSERGGRRFVVTKTDEGKPMIQMEMFHDTVSNLRSLKLEFEVSQRNDCRAGQNTCRSDERNDPGSDCYTEGLVHGALLQSDFSPISTGRDRDS